MLVGSEILDIIILLNVEFGTPNDEFQTTFYKIYFLKKAFATKTRKAQRFTKVVGVQSPILRPGRQVSSENRKAMLRALVF